MQRLLSPNSADSFSVLRQDLDDIERRIMERQQAETLTQLATHLIEGRLRDGVPTDGPAMRAVPASLTARDRVRIWDPAMAWQVGDHGLFALPLVREGPRAFAPRVGEVIRVNENGRGIFVRIDGVPHATVYGTTPSSWTDVSVAEWRSLVEDLVDRVADGSSPVDGDDVAPDLDTWTAYAFWGYGEQLVSELLYAMRQDARFVSLEGRWFLRSLAVLPTPAQLDGLARTLLAVCDCPMTTGEMLRWVPSSPVTGDAGCFGLALALFGRPDLFRNVDVDAWPRWELAGPPIGALTARCAAFDPETYDVLCESGESLTSETVERLWTLGLLASVVAR